MVGRSNLIRTTEGLRGNVRTPGHVVTLWFVAFQNPGVCTGACDNPGEDLAPGRGALAFGGAHIVPRSGKVRIAGKLDVKGEVVVRDTPQRAVGRRLRHPHRVGGASGRLEEVGDLWGEMRGVGQSLRGSIGRLVG